MLSLICVWINGWVNNRGAGDLRRYRAHDDVTVMTLSDSVIPSTALTDGPLARYAKLWVAHTPECRERFPRLWLQRKPLVSDPGMHHGTCVTHVPWCMSRSLTRVARKTFPAFPENAQPAILRIWKEDHDFHFSPWGWHMCVHIWPGTPFTNAGIRHHKPSKRGMHLLQFYLIGWTVEIWEWINNFIPHFIMYVKTYPCWDQS